MLNGIVLSTGATCASWLLGKIGDKGFEGIIKKYSITDIDKKFEEAVSKTSKILEQRYPEVLGGTINVFFREEKIFSELVKLLFKNAKINTQIIKENFDLATLPEFFIEEYLLTLKETLYSYKEFDDILSNNQIYFSIIDMDKNISLISQNTNMTYQEILKITSYLEEKAKNEFDYTNFYRDYKIAALSHLSQVNYYGLGTKSSVQKSRRKIEEIYVKPIFKTELDYEVFTDDAEIKFIVDSKNEEMIFEAIFDKCENIVIKGNPGSGKSILSKYIICSILNRKKYEVFNNEDIYKYLPFRIELRKYIGYKKETGGCFLKYIRNILENEYLVSKISDYYIEKIIRERKVLIIFDGLDEIFDIEEKIEVRNEIELFCKKYSNMLVIVTSRINGYREANLDKELFKEIEISKFDENQIIEYVNKWYKIEEENDVVRTEDVNSFLELIEGLDDELKSNPLLLSLIVILYRNNNILPNSKLEIYRSCTKTLVDKWDEAKKLNICLNELLLKNKENILVNLAFWQYQKNSTKEISLKYIVVLNEITKILIELKIVEDESIASEMANKFLEYLEKRSIYFENNFTHKTFLEYFSAFWIYKYLYLKQKNLDMYTIINQYLHIPYWNNVIELFLCMVDEPQGDCEVLDEIIGKLEDIVQIQKYPFLLKVLPILKNISEKVVNSVITNSLLAIIEYYSKNEEFNEWILDISLMYFESINNDKRKNNIINAIYSINNNFENDIVKQMIITEFLLEMKHTVNEEKLSSDSIGKLEINNLIEALENEYKKTSPKIFTLSLVNEINKGIFNTNKWYEFLECFGKEEFLKSTFKSRFIAHRSYMTMAERYLIVQIRKIKAEQFIFEEFREEIKVFFEKDIEFVKILEEIENQYVYFSKKDIHSAINILDNAKSEYATTVFEMILVKYSRKGNIDTKHLNIKVNQMKNDNIKSELKKLLGMRD